MITVPDQLYRAVPEVDLEHAQRLSAMGELAAGLAHEIQQRLTVIANYANGCVHRLESGRISSAEMISLMKEIAATAIQADEITRRAKNFSKKRTPVLENLNLNGLVNGALEFVREQIDRLQIALELDLAADIPEVFADRTQVSQVIVNLLLNSVEAFEGQAEHRCLSVRSFFEEEFVHVIVEDTGPGVPAENHLLIFDPFYTTKPDGLGIGLGLCRSIIERHRGHMSLDSDEGQGTRIGFSLPRAGHV